MPGSVCEIVRKQEEEYIRGNTQTSKYVNFSMYETIARIDAYLSSKHLSGDTDDLGREKPFFNISVAAANIWMRATDIDRSKIRIRATKSKDWLDSFLATVHLQDWMRRENYGTYLNEWGRVLARYGSAVTKFVKNDSGLHIFVTSWNRMIVDPVEFEGNPQIEILELTEAQLLKRVKTHKYFKDAVDGLMEAITTRETLDKQRKDNRTGYIRLYETHGEFSLESLKLAKGEKAEDGDEDTYVQQMQVVAFVGTRKGRKTEYEDFVVYAGEESESPYRKDDLIKEDNRTLARGAVENLFESQWMQNHAVKTEKDTLDLASRLIFQTADENFLNMNVLESVETGNILIHGVGKPLSQINTGKYDITSMMNFRNQWKQLGQEINGISEAMLGVMPKSGTPAQQTHDILQENYSLFENMTENKGLAIEDMMRQRILPYIKTLMDSSKEVSATLEAHDIARIDAAFLKPAAVRRTNKQIMNAIEENLNRINNKQEVLPIDAGGMFSRNLKNLQDSLGTLGNTRFFKPSEISDTSWEEQFKNLAWEVEVDITGESSDTREALQAVNMALKLVLTPGFGTNKRAQAIVGRMLELTGTMSPVEYAALPDSPAPQQSPVQTDQIQTSSQSTEGNLVSSGV